MQQPKKSQRQDSSCNSSDEYDPDAISDDTSGALLPAYIPREVEHDWYDWWEGQGYFSPQFKSEKRFSLVLPPPNVTGTLHLGHALTCTIQDVLARWHRMRGEQVLWVPGTDHAGISTQVIVEKKLLKERGLTRHDLGREKFLQEVWKWREDKSRAIKEQLRKLGASLDWSRETFTMDAKQCDAVKEAFMRLFEAGLVYRANSLVNWSCVLQSAISDIEVEHRHFSGSTLCKVPGYDDPVEFGVISDFAYKLCDRGSVWFNFAGFIVLDGEIVVSTTRIETMLGDVAVAVHPSDMRYKHLQGVHLWHPFQHRKIPLIFDEVVDVNFGTGIVELALRSMCYNTVRVDHTTARKLLLFGTGIVGLTVQARCDSTVRSGHTTARKLLLFGTGIVAVALWLRCDSTACSGNTLAGKLLVFRTGAVKITPAHDMIDLEVSKRHGLDSISVITEEGRMESNCGVYSGMKRFEARSKLLEDLHTLKLFRGKRDHSVQVPFCTRSEDVVELLLKPQCGESGKPTAMSLGNLQRFIRCKQMAEEAAAAVQDGQLQLEPAYTEKIWYNWLYNNSEVLTGIVTGTVVLPSVSEVLTGIVRETAVLPHVNEVLTGIVTDTVVLPPVSEVLTSIVTGTVVLPHIEDKSTRPHELWVAALSEDHARKKATLQFHLDDTQAHKLIMVQDEDVLDTWFSSALFPFSALGQGILFSNNIFICPLKCLKARYPLFQDQDYRQFYPLSVLETGHDILFFWVARMVMLGARLTHQIPFQKVLLHGILCDAHGRKMSKSLGNVISPENVITGISLEELQQQSHASVEAGLLSQEECDKAVSGQAKLFPKGIPECGTDALRFTLASHNVKNHQISFDVSECHTNRLLCNKLWQATKYTLMCLDKATPEWPTIDDKHKMSIEQRWVLSRLGTAVAEVNTALEKADFHSATQAIRTFLHYELCDIYLESTKLAMKDSVNAPLTCGTLVRCLETTLLCLSPFMPYITEELYQRLPLQSKTDSIMVASYPCTHEVIMIKFVALTLLECLSSYPEQCKWSVWRDEEVESEVQLVLNVVSAIRSLRSRCGTTDTTLTVHVVSKSNNDRQVLAHLLAVMKRLSKCHDIIICTEEPSDINLSTLVDTVGPSCSVYLTTQVGVFRDDKKWSKKQARLLKELEKLVKRTSSIGYKEKTPSHVQKFQADKVGSFIDALWSVV
uniref:valine--tRNA ligase n=1 Tax=Timema monikensis TaxID=170555 RepID=A0A7R9E840_9NEOP|nr:unnamed protein product [Timema monikensis]